MRKIIVLCKYNQARSITAAAALRRFFPEEEILSAGIIANPMVTIPSSILQILDEWNLHERDLRSTSTLDLPQINPEDLILCADEEVKSIFVQQTKMITSEFPHLYVLEDFSKSPLEIPIDPVFLGVAETKNQLARSILLAVRGARKYLSEPQTIVKSHLPQTRQEHLSIQSDFLASSDSNAILIDTGFSIPNPAIWSPKVNEQLFNPMKFPLFENKFLAKNVLRSQFEIDKAAELFLTSSYLDWITQLSKRYSIHVISQPLDELPQHRRYEAILGSIHS